MQGYIHVTFEYASLVVALNPKIQTPKLRFLTPRFSQVDVEGFDCLPAYIGGLWGAV